MEKRKTDESIKAGLQIETGHTSISETEKDKTESSYDKGYDNEQYDKDEEGINTHYDKDATENKTDK